MKVTVTTTEGPLVLEFMPHVAPFFISQFIKLCELGYYEGIPFYRIVKGFMIQTGFNAHRLKDAKHTYSWPTKCPDEWPDAELIHQKGFCNVANAGPGTQSSEWCVFDGTANWLTGKHTVFAVLIDGYETLERIASIPTISEPAWFNGEKSKPSRDATVLHISVDSSAVDVSDVSYELIIKTNCIGARAAGSGGQGTIRASLFREASPSTVQHFVDLITNHPTFYRRNPIHRISKGFAIQCGQTSQRLANANAAGTMPFCQAESSNLLHGRGSLVSIPGTQGQFLIMDRAQPAMDGGGGGCVFGVVTHGFDVLNRLMNRPVEPGYFKLRDGSTEKSKPMEDVHIVDIQVNSMTSVEFAQVYMMPGGDGGAESAAAPTTRLT